MLAPPILMTAARLAPVVEREARGRAVAVDDRQLAGGAGTPRTTIGRGGGALTGRSPTCPCTACGRQWISTESPGCSDSHGTADGVA